MYEGTERARAAAPDLRSLTKVLDELCSGELLASFVKFERERLSADRVRTLGENVRMVSAKLGFINAGFCFSSYDYDGAENVLRASQTEGCVLHERELYAGQESGGEKKLLKSFLLI